MTALNQLNDSFSSQVTSILLQQLKEKEEHDLAYVKKIKEIEILLKAEQDNLDKIKSKKKKLSRDIEIKHLKSSRTLMTEVMLQHQKHLWKGLLQEAQKELKDQETILEELQQSVCVNRLAFYDDIKVFLGNYKISSSSKSYSNNSKASSSALTDTEQEEDDYLNCIEEMISLENKLEELKSEEIQIEEAKRLKIKLEAKPSCGEEFLRNQNLLKDAKDSLKNAEEEVANLKIEIAQKELLLLNKKPNATEVKSSNSQICEEKHVVPNSSLDTPDVSKRNTYQGNSSALKTVTFSNAVEMKNISPTLQNKIVMKSKGRTKTPSPALRKKLEYQLTSKLDETMREILFEGKM